MEIVTPKTRRLKILTLIPCITRWESQDFLIDKELTIQWIVEITSRERHNSAPCSKLKMRKVLQSF